MISLWTVVFEERRENTYTWVELPERWDRQPLFHIWSENDLARYVDTLRGRKWTKYKGPNRWYWSGHDFYRVNR